MNFEDTVYFGCAAYSMLHPHRASELNHLFLVNGNGYEWENGELVNLCGETNFKNGKPRSLKAAISFVFRRRKRDDAFRKKWEAKQKRDMKKNPEKYNVPSDSKMDEIINSALKAMEEAKAKDPKGFAERQEKLKQEIAASRKQWKEAEKFEYRIPTDIKQRVAKQEPTPGAYDGYNHWYPICQYARCLTFPDDIKNEWLDGVIETLQLVLANPPQPKASFPHDPDGKHSATECERTVAQAKTALSRALRIKDARYYDAIQEKRK
jgi:hypothetical protein